MKLAITATGRDVTSDVDPRFGRARYFLVVDTETGSMEPHDNTQNLNAAQGAGIQAGEAVARLGVEAVISGNFGPKAFQVLNAAGIKAYRAHGGSVEDAIQAFKAGSLTEAATANVGGHW
jgi:predicted Fe-Mo cluster-binding NifX family protein